MLPATLPPAGTAESPPPRGDRSGGLRCAGWIERGYGLSMTETALSAVVTVIPVLLVSGFLASGLRVAELVMSKGGWLLRLFAWISIAQGTLAAIGEMILVQALIRGELGATTVLIAKWSSILAGGFLIVEGISSLTLRSYLAAVERLEASKADLARLALERADLASERQDRDGPGDDAEDQQDADPDQAQ